MENLYDSISNSQHFQKFEVDELLFVEYTCLVNDTRSDIWSHNNYFVYVLGGKKMWKTLKREHIVKKGDLIFVKKGATSVYQYFEENFYVLLVFVPDDFIKYVIQKHRVSSNSKYSSSEIKSDGVIPLKADEIFTAYFHSLLLYFKQPHPPPEALLKTKLEELILSTFYTNTNKELIHYFNEICAQNNLLLKEVMESNFHKNLSISDFARMSAKSLSAFKRDFSLLYGTSPGKWISWKRLEYSKYLLETTNMPLDEIVQECGFTNVSHFIRVFRDKFGVTPFQSRKKERLMDKKVG
jgi:AraC-like DNA-binding protein